MCHRDWHWTGRCVRVRHSSAAWNLGPGTQFQWHAGDDRPTGKGPGWQLRANSEPPDSGESLALSQVPCAQATLSIRSNSKFLPPVVTDLPAALLPPPNGK